MAILMKSRVHLTRPENPLKGKAPHPRAGLERVPGGPLLPPPPLRVLGSGHPPGLPTRETGADFTAGILPLLHPPKEEIPASGKPGGAASLAGRGGPAAKALPRGRTAGAEVWPLRGVVNRPYNRA